MDGVARPQGAAPDTVVPAGATRALVLSTMAFVTCFYAWAMFGPLSPLFQQQLHLTESQTSLLVAIPVLLGSVLRVPLGVLTDRYGARRVFPLLMAATVVPLLALSFHQEPFAWLTVMGLLLGLAGASFTVGTPFVNRWYPASRQGFALGIYGMGMGGTVITALTAPAIAQHWGLAAPFRLTALLVVAAGIVFARFAEEPQRPRAPVTSLLASFALFRHDGRAWLLTLFYFLSFGGFVAMFLYLPKLLVGVHHLTPADAGARAAGFALLAVIARPTGGTLADRLGAPAVLAVSFGVTAALAPVLAVAYASILPLTIACLTMAVALGLGTGAVLKMVAQVYPTRVGAVTGVVGAAGGLGGFFPPLVMAAVYSATGSYALGFVLLGVTALLCLALVPRMRLAAAA